MEAKAEFNDWLEQQSEVDLVVVIALQAEIDSAFRAPDSKPESSTQILTIFGYVVLLEDGEVNQPEKAAGGVDVEPQVGEGAGEVGEEPENKEIFGEEEGAEIQPTVGEGTQVVCSCWQVKFVDLADLEEETVSERGISNARATTNAAQGTQGYRGQDEDQKG